VIAVYVGRSYECKLDGVDWKEMWIMERELLELLLTWKDLLKIERRFVVQS
jgi:hypothetical protein